MGDGIDPRYVVPKQGGRGRRVGAGVERFQALFGQAPLGVALSDLSGRFTDVNAGLRVLLEGTGVDPDGGGLADLAAELPAAGEQATAWRRALADVVAGRVPAARAELPVTSRRAASPRWVQVTTAVVALGDRRYLLSVLEDTTSRRVAPERVAEADLRETDLRETDLRETDLRETDLRQADVRETERPA